jgi:hypothetical protein
MNPFSPPPKDETPQPSSLVSDNDTTINLAQIERVNSMSMIELNHNFSPIEFF